MTVETAYCDIQNNRGNHAKEYWHDNERIIGIVNLNRCKYKIIFQNGYSKVVNRIADIKVVYTK